MNDPNQEKTDQMAAKLIAYVRGELNDPTIEYASQLSRMQGGFETATYQFRLQGIQKELSHRMVLRLFPGSRDPVSAAWESIVQNALAEQGHPVAKAHTVCLDKSVLGGAFYVMDYLQGEPMITASLETIPALLARTHVAIHTAATGPVIRSLTESGVNEYTYGLNRHFDLLRDSADDLFWSRDSLNWLKENRPADPERPVICHGDFHPLNILIQDGRVTGVVDWPGFLIADPAYDIANTMWLLTIVYKHLSQLSGMGAEFGPEFTGVDWERFAHQYLDAYRAKLPLDSRNVEYYMVKRSIQALVEGFQGQDVFRHPLIVESLIEFIHKVSDIRVTMPD